jgi:hypothetical protein
MRTSISEICTPGGETPEDPTAPTAPAQQSTLPLLTLRQILSYKPDPHDEYWTGGILTAGENAVIVGAPGVGKSRLAMQAAIETILGKPFMGYIQTNAPGSRWLFIQTENSRRRLHFDLERMTSGLSEDEILTVESCMKIMDVDAMDLASIDLSKGSDSRLRIEQTIEEMKPHVVLLDPLRDASPGDLNKDDQMREVCDNIKEVVRSGDPKRIPLVIHHGRTGKEESRRVFGDDAGSFGRNSKVMNGWVRSQINVASAGIDYPGKIILGCGKCSNGPRWKPFAADLDEDSMMYVWDKSFDISSWAAGASEAPDRSTAAVVEIVREAGGGLEKLEVIARLKSKGIGKGSAWNMVNAAVAEGTVEESTVPRQGKKSAVFLTLAG